MATEQTIEAAAVDVRQVHAAMERRRRVYAVCDLDGERFDFARLMRLRRRQGDLEGKLLISGRWARVERLYIVF